MFDGDRVSGWDSEGVLGVNDGASYTSVHVLSATELYP